MSGGLPGHNLGARRLLHSRQRAVIEHLVRGTAFEQEILSRLPKMRVQEMADGGMGSLKFPRNRPATRHEIRQLAEASFEDDDGVPVSMTLTGDEAGNLLELDVFEADGSPLRRYPKPDQIKRIHRDGKLGYPA